MIPLFLAPLLSQGLSAVANAALAKGTEWVKTKTGIDVTAELGDAETAALKQFENNVEFKKLLVEDNRITAELEKARLEAETAQMQSVQQTAQIEAQSTDEYVRRTRPKIARLSFYFGTGYALVNGIGFPLVNEFFQLNLPAMSEMLLGVLYSPALGFTGMRSMEAFSKGGKK